MDEPGGRSLPDATYRVNAGAQEALTQHCREACGTRQPRVGEDPGLIFYLFPAPLLPAGVTGSPGPPQVPARKQLRPGLQHWQLLWASCKQTAVTSVPTAPRPHYLCQHFYF